MPLPQAYNGSTPRSLRHKIIRPAASRYAEVAAGCADIVRHVRAHSPRARVYMLGLSQLPSGARQFKSIHLDEKPLFAALNAALGVSCAREPDGGGYTLRMAHGVTPLDRYNLWAGRKRDGVHPFFNAHFALVQLLLNHVCNEPVNGTLGRTGTV